MLQIGGEKKGKKSDILRVEITAPKSQKWLTPRSEHRSFDS